jgi:hypothetical protein
MLQEPIAPAQHQFFGFLLCLMLPVCLFGKDTEPSSLDWENQNIRTAVSGYQETYKVSFKGTNHSGRQLEVLAVVPDCSSCLDIVVSPSATIQHGGHVEITATIKISVGVERQIGRLAVFYRGVDKPDTLSYELRLTVPFRLSPKSLIWTDGREAQTFSLYINSSLGLSLMNYTSESPDFNVEVIKRVGNEVQFRVTPTLSGKVRSSLSFNFNYVEPFSSGVTNVVSDRLFLPLIVEESQKLY